MITILVLLQIIAFLVMAVIAAVVAIVGLISASAVEWGLSDSSSISSLGQPAPNTDLLIMVS